MGLFEKPHARQGGIIVRPPYPFCGRPVPVTATILEQNISQVLFHNLDSENITGEP